MKDILILLFFLVSPIISATQYYVKNGGSDAANGLTDGTAWATVAKVNSMTFAPDDIISFKCGSTWTESVSFLPPSSGTSGHPITFNSYSTGAKPILRLTSYNGIDINNKNYVTLDGLEVDGVNSNFAIRFQGTSSYCRITNCDVHDGGMGILVGGYCHYNYFGYNNLYDNGAAMTDHGIYSNGTNTVIEHNDCYGNSGYGIQVYNGYAGQSTDNTIVRYNFCHNNAAGMVVTNGDNIEASYNIVVNNSGAGLVVYSDGTGKKIYNNTIYGNGAEALFINANNSFVRNNIVYGGAIYNQGTGNTLSNNLTSNPLYLNASGTLLLDTDFKIASNSPAKDAGVDVSLTEDYFGVTVPYNTIPDIGANEYEVPGAPVNPVIIYTTSVYASITYATVGGNVTDDGGASVTARGVCWSESANPTTADSKTSNGTGTGTFIATLTPLTASTTYHARAYATNSAGTSYGADVTFTTNSATGRKRYVIYSGQ